MARRRATVALAPIVSATSTVGDLSALDTGILDTTADLLRAYGLHRWSVDDVADRAGIGRTTVYRRFANRDDLVHAVLARELIATVDAIKAAAAPHRRLEDQIVEGALAALGALDGSVVDHLLRSDPATFLPFLTVDAGPLLVLGRELLTHAAVEAGLAEDAEQVAPIAEIGARMGLSFILTRDTVLPVGDAGDARAALHQLFDPLLGALATAAPRARARRG